MKVATTLCMFILMSFPASGDEKAVQKYRNYTPQQLQALPEAVRQRELPIMYILAAQRGLSQGSELLFGMELNSLMYAGLHDYKAAVRAFQGDLGDAPTGVLTVWQIHNLEQRAEMQKLSRVGFPAQFFSHHSDGYGIVRGTVIIIDDQIAWPVNHTTITCSRSENTCEHTQIYLAVPDKTSWSQTYTVMQALDETYQISRWDGEVIEASLPYKKTDCRTTSLSLNFENKEFYYITRNAGGDCEFMGTKIPKLTRPRIAQIVDGKDVIEATFARIQKNAYDVLSNEFRKKVDEATARDAKR